VLWFLIIVALATEEVLGIVLGEAGAPVSGETVCKRVWEGVT
jgi:hypothetical protein